MPDKGIKLLRCVAAKAEEGWHGAGWYSAEGGTLQGPPWSFLEKNPPKSFWEEELEG